MSRQISSSKNARGRDLQVKLDVRFVNERITMSNILLVEDEKVVLLYMEKIIKRCLPDVKTIPFESGEEFIAYMKDSNETPQIVITDIMMGIVSGIDVINYLLSDERYNSTGIVVCTAYFDERDSEWMFEYNIELILKPVKEKELLFLIQKYLKGSFYRNISVQKYLRVTKKLEEMRAESIALRKKYIERLIDPRVFLKIEQHEKLEYKRKEIGIGFVDIRGFTNMANKLPVEKVGEILEIFYETISETIKKHGGFIDKYIGDSIMWIFHDECGEDYQGKCFATCTEIFKKVYCIEEQIAEKTKFKIKINLGIGLAYGEALLGLFGVLGKQSNIHYTCIGPIVNLASRLCHNAAMGELQIAGDFPVSLIGKKKVNERSFISVKGFDYEVNVVKLKYRIKHF